MTLVRYFRQRQRTDGRTDEISTRISRNLVLILGLEEMPKEQKKSLRQSTLLKSARFL